MASAFDEISKGLAEAIRHAEGSGKVKLHAPEALDVREIRERTGLSQQRFSVAFGISVGTLRHWEQGLRTPRGPARVLLRVVAKNPRAVLAALQE